MKIDKPKKKTLAKVKKGVWTVFSIYIRTRDCLETTGSLEWGECVSCGKTKPFKLLDAGHYRPKHSGNYFSERGVHAQCQSCNRYHGGEPLDYRRAIIGLYGEGADLELEDEAREIRKYTIPELEVLGKYYKELTKLLEE